MDIAHLQTILPSISATNTANVLSNTELENTNNHYHILHYNQQVAGFSNIILDAPYPGSASLHLAKLERIYLLKAFYNLSLGKQLFDFNMAFAKQELQSGIWLYVWTENKRAVDFYLKNGFVINGSHDFKISDIHSNPNHRMLLNFN